MIPIWKETKLRCNPHARYTAPDGTKHVKVPTDLYEEIAEPAVPEDYSPDTYYRTEQDEAPYVVYTRKSDEQIAEVQTQRAKALRQAEVNAIAVTVGEKVFDGDERSQDRMSRAITAMDDADEIMWVLADNTPTMVTKAELRSALRLAGEAQTTIWVKPYQ